MTTPNTGEEGEKLCDPMSMACGCVKSTATLENSSGVKEKKKIVNIIQPRNCTSGHFP